mmetsp:Transcript_679/g.1665  ORF Transcript_679/g.1665 Transcript_679/m.1665 type:complete len:261 (-) Transcript_679:270-1052(-)
MQEPVAHLPLLKAQPHFEVVQIDEVPKRVDVDLQSRLPHTIHKEVHDVSGHLGRVHVELEEAAVVLGHDALPNVDRMLHIAASPLLRREVLQRRRDVEEAVLNIDHPVKHPVGKEFMSVLTPSSRCPLQTHGLMIQFTQRREALGKVPQLTPLQSYADVRLERIACCAPSHALQLAVLLDGHELLVGMRVVWLGDPLLLHKTESLGQNLWRPYLGMVRCVVQAHVRLLKILACALDHNRLRTPQAQLHLLMDGRRRLRSL